MIERSDSESQKNMPNKYRNRFFDSHSSTEENHSSSSSNKIPQISVFGTIMKSSRYDSEDDEYDQFSEISPVVSSSNYKCYRSRLDNVSNGLLQKKISVNLKILKNSVFSASLLNLQIIRLLDNPKHSEQLRIDNEGLDSSSSSSGEDSPNKSIKLIVGVEEEKQKQTILTRTRHYVAKWSPNFDHFAIASTSGLVKILSVIGAEKLDGESQIQHPKTLSLFDQHQITLMKKYPSSSIIDLVWTENSKGIITASLDKSLNVWSVFEGRLLRVILQKEIPSCIAFHPNEARIFVTGGLDRMLKATEIVTSKVKDWVQTADLITSVQFSPQIITSKEPSSINGSSYLIAGFRHGLCRIYECHAKFQYITEFRCRNSNKSKSKSKKVVNICFLSDSEFYVNCNDSRIRRFSYVHNSNEAPKLLMKYKGHKNNTYPLQMSAQEYLF